MTFPYLAHVPYEVAFLLFNAFLLALALRPATRQREQPEPPQAKRRAAGIP